MCIRDRARVGHRPPPTMPHEERPEGPREPRPRAPFQERCPESREAPRFQSSLAVGLGDGSSMWPRRSAPASLPSAPPGNSRDRPTMLFLHPCADSRPRRGSSRIGAVSYTHLDVYKRQPMDWRLSSSPQSTPRDGHLAE